jgi:hypothetical protein
MWGQVRSGLTAGGRWIRTSVPRAGLYFGTGGWTESRLDRAWAHGQQEKRLAEKEAGKQDSCGAPALEDGRPDDAD